MAIAIWAALGAALFYVIPLIFFCKIYSTFRGLSYIVKELPLH